MLNVLWIDSQPHTLDAIRYHVSVLMILMEPCDRPTHANTQYRTGSQNATAPNAHQWIIPVASRKSRRVTGRRTAGSVQITSDRVMATLVVYSGLLCLTLYIDSIGVPLHTAAIQILANQPKQVFR